MIEQRTRRRRASAMPPEERRQAIIATTIPLLVAHGAGLTTRQIAEAAGIAEGTIFRVFPDKEALIAAAIERAFDPDPVSAELRAIDPTLPLDERLVAAVGILQRRVATIGQLLMVVRTAGAPCPPGPGWRPDVRDRQQVLEALAEVLEPDRLRLRRPPLEAAQMVQNVTFAWSHWSLVDAPLAPAEIVSVLLDGLRSAPGVGSAC